MSKKPLDNVGPRPVPPGSCTWCGHKPHPEACPSTIRTGPSTDVSCPCSRRTEGTA